MSTDIVDAFDAIQALVAGNPPEDLSGSPLTLCWQNEDNALPDEPAPFVYFELTTDRGEFIELGGGRGSNRFRHIAELHAYLFVPRGLGLKAGLQMAEPIAALFRSYKGGGIVCEGASVHPAGEGEALVPPGAEGLAGNYSAVIVAIPLHFDQVG